MPIAFRFVTYLACIAPAVMTDQPVDVAHEHLRITVDPARGGQITVLGFRGDGRNFAAGEGLLEEGFGVGSFYVPNRRLNERLDVEDLGGRSRLTYRYDCDGPNIAGLAVRRTIEPLPGRPSIRVVWRIENRGTETQWIAPWVRNSLAPGGGLDGADRLYAPTEKGVRDPGPGRYAPAARNWIAVTDTAAKETVYGVFDADDLYAVQSLRDDRAGAMGFTAQFVPRFIAPGDTWETTYRINLVRGLAHVDFATDELAAQLDLAPGRLVLLLTAAAVFDSVELHAAVLTGDGVPQALVAKRFSIDPGVVIRCTYDWAAPAPGLYDFLGELRASDGPIHLGADTRPPHGGIDTVFAVGDAPMVMAPWTDAPFALLRGPRTLTRSLAAAGDAEIWFDSPLNKLFPDDRVAPSGETRAVGAIFLARNEHEAVQLAVRVPDNADARRAQLRIGELVHENAEHRIDPTCLRVYTVGYVPVRIPSYFEGPTGLYPDPLFASDHVTILPGKTQPFWIDVYAPADTRPGVYRAPVELTLAGADPIELGLEVTVLDFVLPVRPSFKTDFGYDREAAFTLARRAGFGGDREALDAAFLENALDHRVTLREPVQMPAESPDYPAALEHYRARLDPFRDRITTVAVPPSLLEFPPLLESANAFVNRHDLRPLAFVQPEFEPPPPAWPRLLEGVAQWKSLAPDVPVTVPTVGLRPFLAEDCAIWTVHSQVLDTPSNAIILEAISKGREVWWYVNHAPTRPYANLLIDFAAVEHRILFWQAYALGIRGMHYASVNRLDAGGDPFEDLLDETPVNGNAFLVYPGPEGPVNSIRWETVRDGLEDYEYLRLFRAFVPELQSRPGHEALKRRAAEVGDLGNVLTGLVTFTRVPEVIESKRLELGRLVEVLQSELR